MPARWLRSWGAPSRWTGYAQAGTTRVSAQPALSWMPRRVPAGLLLTCHSTVCQGGDECCAASVCCVGASDCSSNRSAGDQQLPALNHPLDVCLLLPAACRAGLRPQHLTGLQLIAALCGGRLEGGAVSSSCITLQPGQLACSHHLADTKTAGSCMLLAQSALPCLLFAAAAPTAGGGGGGSPTAAAAATGAEAGAASAAAAAAAGSPGCDAAAAAAALRAAVAGGTASELDLRGGTDASMAPPAGYMQHVLLPVLRSRLGVQADMALVRRGFFPKGQGQVVLTVQRLPAGGCLPAIDLTERGEITGIGIRAFTAGKLLPAIGERLAAAALKGKKGMGAQSACACLLAAVAWVACAALGQRAAAGQHQHGPNCPCTCCCPWRFPRRCFFFLLLAAAEVKARLGRCGVSRQVPLSVEAVHEPPERAFGDGCGILLTAHTSTGCIFGASGGWVGGWAGGWVGGAALPSRSAAAVASSAAHRVHRMHSCHCSAPALQRSCTAALLHCSAPALLCLKGRRPASPACCMPACLQGWVSGGCRRRPLGREPPLT